MKEIITSEYDGYLLKYYLLGKCKISHNLLTRLKKLENGIMLNGRPVRVREILHTGDILELDTDDKEGSDILPIKTSVMPDILYEDDDMMILNKPPHMPTHPSHDHYDDTLANAVAYIFSCRGECIKFRAITRLDKDTSGAVLIAKNARAAAYLSDLMASGKIQKTYTAICEGIPPESFTIDKHIKREAESIITRTVCDEGDGQAALTHFKRIGTHNGRSILKVTPMTGRTHQIRVHVAYAGYPIVGDFLYGSESVDISRQALHASSLTFEKSDGEKITVKAPLFSDMKRLIGEE